MEYGEYINEKRREGTKRESTDSNYWPEEVFVCVPVFWPLRYSVLKFMFVGHFFVFSVTIIGGLVFAGQVQG